MNLSTVVIVGVFALIFGVLYHAQNNMLLSVKYQNRANYDLQTLPVPTLTNWGFKLFVYALETWPISVILSSHIKQQSEFGLINWLVRDAAYFNHEISQLSPTYYPIVHATPAQESFATEQHKNVAEFMKPINDITTSNQINANKFRYWSVDDYANAYRRGTVTPVQVATAIIAAITDSDTQFSVPLRLFISHNTEDILSQAKASTARFASGSPLSIFDGVPVAIKDELDVKGYVTTGGTSFVTSPVAARDCTIAQRFRDQGAVIIGKTNMHECGVGVTSMNPHHGFVRNPYNITRAAGGSSGGSAAVVSAGLVPVAIGSDGGGSIRIPAAICGVYGLKATFGRVSEFGAFPLAWTVVHSGPIASSPRDLALAYALIAGPDANDHLTRDQPAVHVSSFDQIHDFSDLTIGVYPEYNQDAHPQVVTQVSEFIQMLQSRGAKIKHITLPHMQAMNRAHAMSIASEFATSLSRYSQHRHKFSLDTRSIIAIGESFSATDYLSAQMLRTWSINATNQIFKQVDIIITPATASTAPFIPAEAIPHGISDMTALSKLTRYIWLPNFTGHPAVTFPLGYDEHNLPIAGQVITRHWDEHVLLRLSHASDVWLKSRYAQQRPQAFYSILDQANKKK